MRFNAEIVFNGHNLIVSGHAEPITTSWVNHKEVTDARIFLEMVGDIPANWLAVHILQGIEQEVFNEIRHTLQKGVDAGEKEEREEY